MNVANFLSPILVKPIQLGALLLFAHVSIFGQGFELFVTQSPPGPSNQNPATWSGVLHYHFDQSSAPFEIEQGLDKSFLNDPAGFAFRGASSELFVGNRHGNIAASSISRFKYNPTTGALTTNGTITGNGLFGVHQLAINPVSGEMFAANVENGISRFTFNASGEPAANGNIPLGRTRGVAVSPDGATLYVTTAGNVIRRFNLTAGQELAAVTLPGSPNLHFMRVHRGDLFVAGLDADTVYRFRIGTGNDLFLVDEYHMDAPIDVVFSPDNQEMFVSGHRDTDLIFRFAHNSQNDDWTFQSQFDSGSSLGALLVLPNHPRLDISKSGNNNVRISWNLPDDGWILERAGQLPPTNWATVPGPYNQDFLERFTITQMTENPAFFRLIKAP